MEVKYEIIIDPDCEERVVIYAKERGELVRAIEALIDADKEPLIGYDGHEGVRLALEDVCSFLVEDGGVVALVGDRRYRIKSRLYQLERRLPPDFVRIHQSAIANLRQIERFDTSIAGTLRVHYRNGYRDYVSRRQLKAVKEKLGVGK